jgi:diguanylate cyclase (GGDEF)-like protein
MSVQEQAVPEIDTSRWSFKPSLVMLYTAVAAVIIFVYFQMEGVQSSLVYSFSGLLAVVMIVVGVRRNKPSHPSAWYLVATGLFLMVLGDGIWIYYNEFTDIAPWPSVADASYIMGYVVVCSGLLVFVRARSQGKDRAGLIDSSIVATSLAVLAWIFLMQPYASDASLTFLEKAISVAYPLMDVAILALLARLLMTLGPSSFSYRALTMTFLLFLVADTLYGVQVLATGTYGQGFTIYLTDGFWLSAYALTAIAALHPSMRKLSQGADHRARPNKLRLAVLAAALLVMPGILGAQAAMGTAIDVAVIVAGSGVLVVLTFARMSGLIGEVETKIGELEILGGELEHQAFHDSLTGVANRRLFGNRVEHARRRSIRNNEPMSVLFLDLDDFKSVNDTLGHSVGDELLSAVARRVEKCIRPEDTLGRIGGDEFAILLETAGRNGAAIVGERLVKELTFPFELSGEVLSVHASLGIVTDEDNRYDTEELLQAADIAMYQAKKSGKGRYAFFNQGMGDSMTKNQGIKRELETALEEGQLVVHYQPFIELASGKITGTEALVRWQHPVRGLLAPSEFLPVAQESGLIEAIDSFVLREGIRQTAKWLKEVPDPHAFRMSINLSEGKLSDPYLVAEVEGLIGTHQIHGQNLILEITETQLLTDTEMIAARLHELKSLGVQIALDDFGTGFSSLAYIRRFPIDVLKIDKSFVDDLGKVGHSSALAQVINSLGRQFKMVTIAEGVETPAQLAELQALPCEMGQGYLFARPASPSVIGALVREGSVDFGGFPGSEESADTSHPA